ncbi:MAG: LysM peptidoglycan-binding domain-containing protein, partial [Bdellovibrionota bacterium]
MSIRLFLHQRRLALLALALLSLGLPALDARAAKTPEQESLELSRILKPVSDDRWKEIAGQKFADLYEIVQGDTLYDISKRLFGDGKYWPKVWALNNGNITNPHLIHPGNAIAFQPGSGSSLPSVAITTADNSGTSNPSAPATKSDIPAQIPVGEDWKYLPRQRWEDFQVTLPPEVDPLGFDKNSKITFSHQIRYELPTLVASEDMKMLGEITGSRSEGEYLTMNDTVFISANGDAQLQVGDTYTLTKDSTYIKGKKSDRVGYAYPILGKVRIVGVRDGVFIGSILSGADFIARSANLIPVPAPIGQPDLIPGPAGVQGILYVDRSYSTLQTVQHKEVFIDRGSEDGVKQGMVFRAYEHYDPSNNKKVTDSDFIVSGDILVLQVSEKFCAGIVIRSLLPIDDQSPVTLLTDVSELIHKTGVRMKTTEGSGDAALDELDKLDSDSGLGKEEERELQQLEKWKGNPSPTPEPAPAPSATPGSAPTPTPSATSSEPLPPPPPPPAPNPTDTPPAAQPTPPATPATSEELPPPPPP